ncbi:MAG: cytochrome c3 family protein [Pseudomonadota bacterium]
MKYFNQYCKALLGFLLITVWAGYASAGVVGSQHDLTTAGAAQGGTANTDEVCVFCHTPHGSDVNAPVPLWNKVLGAPGTYTQYSSLQTPTFDGQEAPVGSVSLACLSCHDGTQAMDVVINLPGSGGHNPAGAEIDPIALGTMAGTPVPNLGTDLTDDHPISVQYGGGGALVTDPDGTFTGLLGDPDFNPPEKATVNTNPIWWVDSIVGTAGTREKTDMILYARNDLGTVQPFVECGSCHDPHNDTTKGATSVAFLRITNTASQICTACHTK